MSQIVFRVSNGRGFGEGQRGFGDRQVKLPVVLVENAVRDAGGIGPSAQGNDVTRRGTLFY